MESFEFYFFNSSRLVTYLFYFSIMTLGKDITLYARIIALTT